MDVDSSSKSGASSMVPLGVGLLGLVIGVIALFVAFNAASKTQLGALSDTVAATASKADAAKAEADGIAGKVDATTSALAGLRSQAQDAFTAQQASITQLTTELASLKSSGTRTTTSSGKTGTAAETTNVGPNGGTYIIAEKDLLGNIAKRYGVTVKEILDANPGVEPTKLHPGQKITIPPQHSSGASTRSSSPAPSASGATGPATAVAP